MTLFPEEEIIATNTTVNQLSLTDRYTYRPLTLTWYNTPAATASLMIMVHRTGQHFSAPVWLVINISPNITRNYH
jgi:hypothetical protein